MTFNIGKNTAFNMLKRWRNNGFKVVDGRKPGTERCKRRIKLEDLDMLCSLESLNAMKNMSLAE